MGIGKKLENDLRDILHVFHDPKQILRLRGALDPAQAIETIAVFHADGSHHQRPARQCHQQDEGQHKGKQEGKSPEEAYDHSAGTGAAGASSMFDGLDGGGSGDSGGGLLDLDGFLGGYRSAYEPLIGAPFRKEPLIGALYRCPLYCPL